MKYLRLVFVFICFSFLPTAKGQQLKGDTWQSIKSTGSGEVTMTYNFSGEFIHKGSNGLEGLCYQIWQEFIKYTPVMETFARVIEDKKGDTTDRALLVKVLKEQYLRHQAERNRLVND